MTTSKARNDRKRYRAFHCAGRALVLVWNTSCPLTVAMLGLVIVGGALPAAIAYVAALIVDTVAEALRAGVSDQQTTRAMLLVLSEGGLVAATAGVQRAQSMCQTLMRAKLSQRVYELILQKALTLELAQFENSEFYDKLIRAYQGAINRPMSLVERVFGLAQNAVALVSLGALIISLSPWAPVLLVAGGAPAFLADAKFSGETFRLFEWRAPETRRKAYLAAVLTRDDYAKEVLLFGLGQPLLHRYRDIYRKLYREDRNLTIRRDTVGILLGILGACVLYGAYAWVVIAALAATISIGQMAMYLMLFRQGQATVSAALKGLGGMYEDNLYIATLYDLLDTPVSIEKEGARVGPQPGDGIRFENVTFAYPNSDRPVLVDVNLHIRPGESLSLVGENGSGKTTLIKLLSGLYRPTGGRVLLDGLDLRGWDVVALRARVSVVFQDFVHYQFLLGENIGVGDVSRFENEAGWREAGERVQLDAVVKQMPHGYRTQLGRWFDDGRELSGGQWQRVALARAVMRNKADILILDEPTAAMDARAEAEIFECFRSLAEGRTTILISHRFSTARLADRIAVLKGGQIIELGSHEELVQSKGHYNELFELQASAYR